MSTLKYEALIKRYQADAAEAKAILEVYFGTSVGIGEHPQIIAEMDKQVEILATAEDKLEALQRLVNIEDAPLEPPAEEE